MLGDETITGAVYDTYVTWLDRQPLAARSRQAYRAQVGAYLRWLADSGNPEAALTQQDRRDWAVRDYKRAMKQERGWSAASVNQALAAIDNFYRSRQMGRPEVARRTAYPGRRCSVTASTPHGSSTTGTPMLRTAATIRHGHLPASLLISRLQASARQNQLTRAIQEYGRIIKTTSILRYLHDEGHRRRIHAQLNKGETLHALRRQLFFANQGQLRRRSNDDQDIQGESLTLLTNAIIAWNTTYIESATQHLTATGTHIPTQHLTHLSPAIHEHINLYGKYDFTNPTPPPTGQLRPLRTP